MWKSGNSKQDDVEANADARTQETSSGPENSSAGSGGGGGGGGNSGGLTNDHARAAEIMMRRSGRSVSKSKVKKREQEQQEKEEEIGKTETQHVFLSRLVVLAVLVISALLVSISVYLYVDRSEHNQFVAEYESSAGKVLESVGTSLDNTLGAADSFAVRAVSFAGYSNASWPFVTMPDFSIEGNKLLKLSKAFSTSLVPLVTGLQQVEWQDYAKEHAPVWIDKSLAVQEKELMQQTATDGEAVTADMPKDYETKYELHNAVPPFQDLENPRWCFPDLTNPEHGNIYQMKCYYQPNWMTAPFLPSIKYAYNGDIYGSNPTVAQAVLHSYKTRHAVLSGDGLEHMPADQQKVVLQAREKLMPMEADPSEPVAVLIYPVLQAIDSVRINITTFRPPPVVARLSLSLRYDRFFKNVLPYHSKGIVVVIHQDPDCGSSFTYQLNGPDAVYLGVGDLHDPRYNGDLVYSAQFADLLGSSASSSYTGLPMADYCAKSIRVYPSLTLEEKYKSGNPAGLAIIAACIFLFTSFVFIMYDWLVSRRQRIVMNRAIASGTIVSSLFPEKVKQQLYEEQKHEQEAKAKKSKFLAMNPMNQLSQEVAGGEGEAATNRPIADYYSATTVLLADLAGFTKWSSERTPAQVFELLETIYGAFDEIAVKRDVFKIETIGDCYVAVTGIPEPQKDHAVRMVKFARACLNEMNRVTSSLVEKLGNDTEDLQLRIGLDSGPATAGVLRGDKARFQLFGDTINNASRMEHYGKPGQIHVSEATAKELTALGKANWVTPRSDKIVFTGVRGKPDEAVQTYWASVRSGTSSRSNFTRTTTPSVTGVSHTHSTGTLSVEDDVASNDGDDLMQKQLVTESA